MTPPQDKLEADRRLLLDARGRGTLATLSVYFKLSGPGWLQSALTLGGGSLASSLYLGVLAGFAMLWLQPLAMILGIVMLSAIGYVTMSTGERPFQAINRHVNPVLGWSWALASLAANMVWCLPQYSLATGVLQQNLLPNLLGEGGPLDDFNAKLVITISILVLTTVITWAYDSGTWGIKLYELLLKLMVGLIVVCFAGVVVRIILSSEGLPWRDILWGFVPDVTRLFRPASGFQPLLQAVDESYRDFWTAQVVGQQRDVAISAAATAVGINMTFLLPYSMLARGWGKEFRGLAKFDLATSMLIPFLLATSCVIIASANRFHPRADTASVAEAGAATAADVLSQNEIDDLVQARLRYRSGGENDGHTGAQNEQHAESLSDAELQLASHLKQKDAFDLARSLEPLTGRFFGHVIFGIGVLGMTLSTITLLMLISGFVICEMLGLPATGWPYRLGTLAAATGVLGPFYWKGASFYLAVPTSVFAITLLPIAYLTFFLLMNQKSLLGEEMPRGGRRVAWNLLMAAAAGTATVISVWTVWNKAGYWGLTVIGGLLLLTLVVQVRRRGTSRQV